MSLLYCSTEARGKVWAEVFAEAGEDMIMGEEAVSDPEGVTHIACWLPPKDLSRYPNLSVVINVGAGVDHMPKLPDGVALSRTIAPGIEHMVRDWVVMGCLMLHRDMPAYLAQAEQGLWQGLGTSQCKSTRVGIMGMGRIGALAAETLGGLGFPVAGWSRSGTAVPGVEMFDHAGLDAFLAQTDLLVCLLPLTDETRGILGTELFAKLPKGACLVHAGRGAHLDMEALRLALDEGQLSTALLDVTNPEPLPAGHWAWRDPRVIVTPHVAAVTDSREGAQHALNVIRADRIGEALPGLVNQKRGY